MVIAGHYLGHLPTHDPLHSYLRDVIWPQFGSFANPLSFRVFRLAQSHHSVYLYEERQSGLRVIGKFFGPPHQESSPATIERMQFEFEALALLRHFGLDGYPHHIVRPLGTNRELSSLLVEEYVEGHGLAFALDAAIAHASPDTLYANLTALAYFLATCHNRTATGQPVDFAADCAYLDRLVHHLMWLGRLHSVQRATLHRLRDLWRAAPHMWSDQQVLVHGDATPANFIFGPGLQVTAIDLERLKRADRVFDVGRLAGELQYAFIAATGNKYAAEPFIGHFLWEYACHFPDRERAFAAIALRLPFHMALTLLRIARNTWVSAELSQRLIDEAILTLGSIQ